MSESVEGLEEIKANLARVADSANALKAGVKAAGEIVRKDASARAPVRTGKLSRNIILVEEDNKENPAVKIGPAKKVFYGKFIERGTSKMAARPFLRPALDENKDAIRQEIAKAMKEAISKAIR